MCIHFDYQTHRYVHNANPPVSKTKWKIESLIESYMTFTFLSIKKQ